MDPKLLTPAPDRPPWAADDRELLLALFNVVCALAERVTGERVEVLMRARDGEQFWASPNALLGVRWSRSEGAPGVPPSPTPTAGCTPAQPPS
jgi:hypothetical protein